MTRPAANGTSRVGTRAGFVTCLVLPTVRDCSVVTHDASASTSAKDAMLAGTTQSRAPARACER